MQPILFIQYPKCSTCQKAKKWLDEHHVNYTDRHIVEHNPTVEELTGWIGASELPIEKFFNTSGMIYRDQGLKNKLPSMAFDEKVNLLASNGMLVKRPLIVRQNGTVLIGFKPIEWEKALL